MENECQMRHYEREAPGLLNTIKQNYWHRSAGTQQRLVVVRTMINRTDVEKWKVWSNDLRVKLGTGWLNAFVKQLDGLTLQRSR